MGITPDVLRYDTGREAERIAALSSARGLRRAQAPRRGGRALRRHRQQRRRAASAPGRSGPAAGARRCSCPSATRRPRRSRCQHVGRRRLRDRGRCSRTSRRSSRRPAATGGATRPSARSSPSTARAGSPRSSSPALLDGDALPPLLGRGPSRRTASDREAAAAARAPTCEIVAATNFKQRTRKMLEYYHADRLELRGRRARRTGSSTTRASSSRTATAPPTSSRSPTCTRRRSTSWPSTSGCPSEIRSRPPTTDTYSLPQSQEEFYFSLPYREMDLCLCAKNHGVPPARSPRRPGSPPSRSNASTATSTTSGARPGTSTCARCWSRIADSPANVDFPPRSRSAASDVLLPAPSLRRGGGRGRSRFDYVCYPPGVRC